MNLSPQVRFNFCNIKLIAIVKTKDIREVDNYPLLSDFINTVNQLNSDDGLEIKLKDEFIKIFGFIGYAIGDTLALQSLGGFLEDVGRVLKFCRTCHIHHDDRLEHFGSKFNLRDIETHLCQLDLIKDSPDLSKQYGIKNKSVLLNLNEFDICQCLLHDPMHVIVEGICINELKNLLVYLTKTKKVELRTINKRIMEFDYFFIDKDDKPNNK